MYRALVLFTDTQDNDYRYNPGDRFPRKGKEVSATRINELLSNKNLRGKPVIAAEKEVAIMPAPVAESETPAAKKDAPKKRGRKRAD